MQAAISAMATTLAKHAGIGVIRIAADVYNDYRTAASEGNGLILFKNESNKGQVCNKIHSSNNLSQPFVN